jgi:hypothetical protein
VASHPAVEAVYHAAGDCENPHRGHDDHRHGDIGQQPLHQGPGTTDDLVDKRRPVPPSAWSCTEPTPLRSRRSAPACGMTSTVAGPAGVDASNVWQPVVSQVA